MKTEKANKTWIITLLAVIVALGAGFFGGMKYQQSQRQTFTRSFGQNNNNQMGQEMRGANGVRSGFRPVNGEIIKSDSSSLTVKLQDGSSKIVILSDNTQINKAATATKDDLKTGEKVAVFGTDNPDGSVTATSVQLNPTIGRSMPSGQPAAQ